MSNVTISGFTQTTTNPFVDIYGSYISTTRPDLSGNHTYWYGGLSTILPKGNYYYNDPSSNPYLYVFQRVDPSSAQATGTVTINSNSIVYYYLVGGGASGNSIYGLVDPSDGATYYYGGAGGGGGYAFSGIFSTDLSNNKNTLNLTIGNGGGLFQEQV